MPSNVVEEDSSSPKKARPQVQDGDRFPHLDPCRLCGSIAAFGEVDDMDHPDFGGHFIACTNARCQCSVGLRYADKEDPRPLLAEQWNREPAPSSLVDDEDERGFTPSDYAHTAELLRSSEPIRKAAASNNHNIILAALDRCAAAPVDAIAEQGSARSDEEPSLSLHARCQDVRRETIEWQKPGAPRAGLWYRMYLRDPERGVGYVFEKDGLELIVPFPLPPVPKGGGEEKD